MREVVTWECYSWNIWCSFDKQTRSSGLFQLPSDALKPRRSWFISTSVEATLKPSSTFLPHFLSPTSQKTPWEAEEEAALKENTSNKAEIMSGNIALNPTLLPPLTPINPATPKLLRRIVGSLWKLTTLLLKITTRFNLCSHFFFFLLFC